MFPWPLFIQSRRSSCICDTTFLHRSGVSVKERFEVWCRCEFSQGCNAYLSNYQLNPSFWGAITFSVAPGSLKKEHNCCLKCLQTRQSMWSIFHWQLKPNDPHPVIYLLPAAVCDQQTLRMLDTYEGKGSITFSRARAQLCAPTLEPEPTSVFLGQFCLLLTLGLVRTKPIHKKISNSYTVSLNWLEECEPCRSAKLDTKSCGEKGHLTRLLQK